MKKVLKWIGIVAGVLLAVIIISAISLHLVGRSRLNNAPDVITKPVTVPTDAAAIARGEHLANSVSNCRMCHGKNLEGEVLIDGEIGLYVFASNLTSGDGGIGAVYSDADWERAIRHGIGGDNRVLAIMPSNFYQHYSDEDLGALMAYLKSVPPVDNDLGTRRIGFPGSVLGGFPGFDEFTRINGIDHANVGTTATPAEGTMIEYGQYLTTIGGCSECHAGNLAGITGTDGPPPGPNLTPGGPLQTWSEQGFVTALHTGVTPSGYELDSEQMPWQDFGKMTDVELQAIWAYLQSLPALPNNP